MPKAKARPARRTKRSWSTKPSPPRRRTAPLPSAERAAINAAVTQALARVERRVPATVSVPRGAVAPSRPVDPRWAAEQKRREQVRVGQRARRLPYTATAITAATGYWSWGVAEVAEAAAGPAGQLITTTTTGVVTGSVLAAIRYANRERIRPWRCRFRLAAAGATSWVTIASIDGAGWAMLGTLAAGAAALSAGWLRAHEVPIPPGDKQPVPEAVSSTAVQDLAVRWSREVGAAQSKLASGCQLTEGRQLHNRLEYTLELTKGMTLGKIRSLQEGIASAMGLDPVQLTFDYQPAGENGFRDTSKIATQVILSSPITGPVYYRGPRFTLTDDGFGLISLGPYIDGEDPQASYELFRPSGMFSGVVIGSTGKGKSSVVNGIAVSARSSGLVTTLYFDPKGNSSPDLARHATIAEVGMDQAETFTVAVETLVEWLGKQASVDNRSVFTPSEERPGYLIVIDECDILFALTGMGDRWGRIAKTGRSLGVGLLLATQYAGMKAFGNNEMLRSSVRAGNVVLMRTESNTSDALIAPDLPKSTTLPAAPGYAYLKNEGSRAAALRSAWLLTSDEPVPAGFPPELADYNADVALAQYPDAAMCPIGIRATQWLAQDGSTETRQVARAERLRGEIATFLATPLPAPRSAPEPGVGGVAPVLVGMGARFAALPGPLAPVVPIRPGVEQPGDVPRLGANQRAVLAALRGGHHRAAAISERTGLPGYAVSKAAAALVERGLAAKRGHGEWDADDVRSA